MTSPLRAALVGYGRMGRAIEAELVARGHEVAARLARGWEASALPRGPGAVAFEFTTPDAARESLARLAEAGIPTICGTTGFAGVDDAGAVFEARGVPFLHAPNFSLGVQLFLRMADLLGAAARRLPGYDTGLVERHHVLKKDAPSGTARAIATRVEGRSGKPVPILALRQGGQPGEHRLVLEGPEETLEIVHRARSRSLFAAGAVAAAEWLVATGRRGHVPFDAFVSSLIEEETP